MLLRSFCTTLALVFSISREGGAQCLTAKLDPTALKGRELQQWARSAGHGGGTAGLYEGRCLYQVQFYMLRIEVRGRFETVLWKVMVPGEDRSPVIYEQVLAQTADYLHTIHDVTQRCQAQGKDTPTFYGTLQLGAYNDGWLLAPGSLTIDSMHVQGEKLPKHPLFRTTCVTPS